MPDADGNVVREKVGWALSVAKFLELTIRNLDVKFDYHTSPPTAETTFTVFVRGTDRSGMMPGEIAGLWRWRSNSARSRAVGWSSVSRSMTSASNRSSPFGVRWLAIAFQNAIGASDAEPSVLESATRQRRVPQPPHSKAAKINLAALGQLPALPGGHRGIDPTKD